MKFDADTNLFDGDTCAVDGCVAVVRDLSIDDNALTGHESAPVDAEGGADSARVKAAARNARRSLAQHRNLQAQRLDQ